MCVGCYIDCGIQLAGMYRGDPMKCKKKLSINSLSAAICNVALFKTMKQREFKDSIFISYSQQGVILEAITQEEWQRANTFIESFINTKRVALLAFGFEKEAYEELIVKGLKEYTKTIKDRAQECPYINIIHYQKLRKSCEYMDKERYLQPLKDWERKNKKNPNFAFLIVEPISSYQVVKKSLLQYLLKREVRLQQQNMPCLYFLLLFFNSSIKDQLRDNYEKTYLETYIQYNKDYTPNDPKDQEFIIRVVNYTHLKLNELDYQIIAYNKHLSRLGLEFISAKEIEAQIKKVKTFLPSTTSNLKKEAVSSSFPFEQMQADLLKKYGQDYCVIPFKKNEKEKYQAVINKFVNASSAKNIAELDNQIKKHIICSEDDIEILDELSPQGQKARGYKILKACINDCPFMIHQYAALAASELQTFLLYIQQLKTYYCSYLVRFYGISIKYGHHTLKKGHVPAEMSLEEKMENYTYLLIFDYHHRTIDQMLHNDMILDNFQIAQITLQVIYLVYFLHHHEEPRALGSIHLNELYWPLRIVLPYLKFNPEESVGKHQKEQEGYFSCEGEGFEGDVRLGGEMMLYLLRWGQQRSDGQQLDDHFGEIVRSMIKRSKYERVSLQKCMGWLQDLLQIK